MVLYQLLVRLFGNQNPAIRQNGSLEQNGCGTFADLSVAAITSIKALGATHIWLTGIVRHATQTDYSNIGMPAQHPAVVKGVAGSPYAVTDFFELDPDLALKPENRWQEFSDCLTRIHARGLGAVVDFIPNHTARQYSSPKGKEILGWDLGERDRSDHRFAPENNYYYIAGQPLQLEVNKADANGNAFEEVPAKATGNDAFTATPSHFDWFETVKLNYGLDPQTGLGHYSPIPPTWQYMREVLRYWAQKGVDGFRCDMVEMVPVPFWAWVIPKIKAEFPAVFFIGEVYNPALYQRFLNEARFDFLYDKVEMYDTLRDLVEEKGDANRLTRVWQNQEGFGEKMLRFLENHDEQRIASAQVGKDARRGLPAMAIAALSGNGPVMLYFGQELGEKAEGETGFSGDDGKTTIFDYATVPTVQQWCNGGRWNEEGLSLTQAELRRQYAHILKLAAENELITHGNFYDLQYANHTNPHFDTRLQYAFLRYSPAGALLVVASFSAQEQVVRLVIPPEVWQTLGLEVGKPARLTDVFDPTLVVSFFPSATYTSDGGSAGLVLRVKAFGYSVLSLDYGK